MPAIRTESWLVKKLSLGLLAAWIFVMVIVLMSMPFLWLSSQGLTVLAAFSTIVGFAAVVLLTVLVFPKVEQEFLAFLLGIRDAFGSEIVSLYPYTFRLEGSEFRMKVGNWRRTCVDEISYLLGMAQEADYRELLDAFRSNRTPLRMFLSGLWDQKTGGFAQYLGGAASVYSTYQVIATIKRLSSGDFLSARLDRNFVYDFITREQLSRAEDFVRRSMDLRSGGFFDAPLTEAQLSDADVKPPRPSVSSTHAAYSFLWIIGAEENVKEQVFDFITERCFMPATGEMSNHPGDSGSPTSLFFGLRVLERVSGKGPIWIDAQRDKVISWLAANWAEVEISANGHPIVVGGFKSSDTDPSPALLQTTFGSAILIDIFDEWPFFDRHRRQTLNNLFEVNKSTAHGAYKFRPEVAFSPNVFVTRNALTALRLLSSAYEDFVPLYERQKQLVKDFARQIVGLQKTAAGYEFQLSGTDREATWASRIGQAIAPILIPAYARILGVELETRRPDRSRDKLYRG